MNSPIKYVAKLAHVREVSLLGKANLAFWKARLEKENLSPIEGDGHAQILITTADSKYMGVKFKELSFSVLACSHPGRAKQVGAYLVHAFNSSRFFAFCERVMFSTPYYHGDVSVTASCPASITLAHKGEIVFRAEMQAAAPGREPSHQGEDGWEGPVFLPGNERRKDRPGHWFFAKIAGHTLSYPFLPAQDAVTIKPSPDGGILQLLVESNFVGEKWAIRADATHAKSKTYKRSEIGEKLAQV